MVSILIFSIFFPQHMIIRAALLIFECHSLLPTVLHHIPCLLVLLTCAGTKGTLVCAAYSIYRTNVTEILQWLYIMWPKDQVTAILCLSMTDINLVAASPILFSIEQSCAHNKITRKNKVIDICIVLLLIVPFFFWWVLSHVFYQLLINVSWILGLHKGGR